MSRVDCIDGKGRVEAVRCNSRELSCTGAAQGNARLAGTFGSYLSGTERVPLAVRFPPGRASVLLFFDFLAGGSARSSRREEKTCARMGSLLFVRAGPLSGRLSSLSLSVLSDSVYFARKEEPRCFVFTRCTGG